MDYNNQNTAVLKLNIILYAVCLSVLADIDECSQSPPKCGNDQACENYPGTYRCYCNSPGTNLENGMCEGKKQ